MPIGHYLGMKLSAYLKAEGLSPTAFARRVGVNQSTIARLVSGQRGASMSLIARIKDATNGVVTADDFLPQQEPAE